MIVGVTLYARAWGFDSNFAFCPWIIVSEMSNFDTESGLRILSSTLVICFLYFCLALFFKINFIEIFWSQISISVRIDFLHFSLIVIQLMLQLYWTWLWRRKWALSIASWCVTLMEMVTLTLKRYRIPLLSLSNTIHVSACDILFWHIIRLSISCGGRNVPQNNWALYVHFIISKI